MARAAASRDGAWASAAGAPARTLNRTSASAVSVAITSSLCSQILGTVASAVHNTLVVRRRDRRRRDASRQRSGLGLDDHAARQQSIDLDLIEAGLTQDLDRVLTDLRRRRGWNLLLPVHPHGAAHRERGAGAR